MAVWTAPSNSGTAALLGDLCQILPGQCRFLLTGGHDDVGRVAPAAIIPNARGDLGLDASAGLRHTEPFHQRCLAPLERPLRKQRAGAGTRCRVRVLVDGHVHAAPPGLVHQPQRVHAAPPVRRADDLVVGNLNRQVGFFADADGLADAGQHSGGLITDVRDVNSTRLPGHVGQCDDLFGRGEVSGHVKQAG